jgi:hypothetical protein
VFYLEINNPHPFIPSPVNGGRGGLFNDQGAEIHRPLIEFEILFQKAIQEIGYL